MRFGGNRECHFVLVEIEIDPLVLVEIETDSLVLVRTESFVCGDCGDHYGGVLEKFDAELLCCCRCTCCHCQPDCGRGKTRMWPPTSRCCGWSTCSCTCPPVTREQVSQAPFDVECWCNMEFVTLL